MKDLNLRYVVTLALVAGGILVFGYLLRPTPPPSEEPIQAPSQTELSRLARITQRRSLENMTEYFGTLAADVQGAVVALPGLDRSGLVWEPGVVLTVRTEHRFPGATTLSTPDGDIGVARVVSGPQIPIVTLRVSDIQGLSEPRRQAAMNIEPGAWILAVWRRLRQTKFLPAHFLDTDRVKCGTQLVEELRSNVAWTQDMAGAGLFDLDGNLIGVVIPCDDRFTGVTVESVDAMLREGRAVEGRVVGRYGLKLDVMTEEEQQHFESRESVIVREVWTGHLADLAGFQPGDILVAINAEPIGALEQLRPLAEPVGFETFDVALRRRGELVIVVLPTSEVTVAPDDDTRPAGIVWEPEPSGYLIDAVVPDSPADVAGLRSGDRLVRIDMEAPEDLNQVDEVLSPDRVAPVFLEIDRRGQRWGVLLP